MIISLDELIGTVRREYLDRTLFWTKADLETKLFDFQQWRTRLVFLSRDEITER